MSENPAQKPSDLEPVIYLLKHPITVAGREVIQMVFQPMKAGYMRSLPDDPIDMSLDLMKRMTGLTSVEIDELRGEDYAAVMQITRERVLPFLGSGKAG